LRYLALVLFFLMNSHSWALSPEAQEFMQITGQLGPRLAKSSDVEDLPAISRQRVEAFYRCD